MGTSYQVVIVGGGLAGSCLALTLSQRCQGALSIALIDALPIEPLEAKRDDRAIALSYSSCQQLAALGLEATIAAATAIESIQISEAGHSGFACLQAPEQRLPWLGKVLPMPLLRQQLALRLQGAKGVTLYAPQTVQRLTLQPQQAQLELATGEAIIGDLVVMATGTSSRLLSSALCYQTWDHQQQALIATLMTAEPHQGRAFERFTRGGSVAIVPKNAEQCGLIWCQASARQQALLALPEADFLQQLQQQFGWRLGSLLQVRRRQCFPLITQIAQRPFGHRWVAIGNAAQTLHPIAGQGFNLALRDVQQLVDSLLEAGYQQDLGSYRQLNHYWQRRQPDQQRLLAFTRGLLQWFDTQQPAMVLGRTLGLRLWDSTPLLKRSFLPWLSGASKR